MPASLFSAIATLADHLTADQVEAARLVMVEGRTLAWAGERYGWTRQAVGYHVKQLEALADNYAQARELEGAAALPRGWRAVTLRGPKALVSRWEAEAKDAAAELATKGKAKKSPA